MRAVTGIGRPEAFFESLAERGLEVVGHAFPDHHRFVAGDVDFGDALPVLVTSKDAVKLGALLPVPPGVVEVRARALLDAAFERWADACAADLSRARAPAGDVPTPRHEERP